MGRQISNYAPYIGFVSPKKPCDNVPVVNYKLVIQI